MNTNEIIDEILKQIKQPLWENWYIKQKIGSGAFSAVYKVEAQRTSRRTSVSALKIEPITADEKPFINEERKRNYIENKRRSAETEAEIMYSLRKCPYIVSYEEEDIRELYINGVFEGYYYLIRMEFLNAISTLIHTKSFDFSEDNIMQLASDIGKGIKAAHRLGIIHRDIKLDNFFVDEFGGYKLGDFNISKKTGAAKTFAGTPGYLAPEIYRAKSSVDQVYTNQADIYSFGICLYQLTNDLLFPFEDELDSEEAIDKRMEGVALPPPKNASPEFAKIILKACEFETAKRYETIREMLDDISDVKHSSAKKRSENPVVSGKSNGSNEKNEIVNNKKFSSDLGLGLQLDVPNNEGINISGININAQQNSIPSSVKGTVLAIIDEDEDTIKPNPEIRYDLKANGEFVEFGSYYVAVNNIKMPLRWKILSIEDDKALIITYMGIDVRKFNDSPGNATWESSSIRKWLNTEFYNEAFSPSEKQLIVEADLMNYKNVNFRTGNGSNTRDNVFLLSIEEAQRFFPSNEDRIVKPTAYARSKGAYSAPNGNAWWWLRSSGSTESYAADVDYGGDVDSYGSDRFFGMNCVRPALWISLAFLNENRKNTFKESFFNSHSNSVNTNQQKNSLNNTNNILKPNTIRRTVKFGQYFYNDMYTKVPIEWFVLSSDSKKALIISANGIDCVKYHSMPDNVTWESSQIRSWLNSQFLSIAFTDKERKLIKPVTLSTPDNPLYGTVGGMMTSDSVFLLSINEANMYFKNNEERLAKPTPYAKSKGLFVASNGCSWWWMRSSGNVQNYAADIDYGGDIDFYGSSVFLSQNALRPAMWVDIKALG